MTGPARTPTEADTATRRRLLDIFRGSRPSFALYAAVQLGIADALGDGPLPASAVAERTKTDARSMTRFLRVLHGLGVLGEQDGAYSLTPMGALLRRDAPATFRAAILYSGEFEVNSWRRLADGIRTGRTPYELEYGTTTFEYLADPEHAQTARLFDGYMSAITTGQGRALVSAYDFGGYSVVTDVGGGDGSLLTTVLGAHPQLRGILYDLPHVVEAARPKLDAAGVAERCRVVGGSFFDEVPAGGDLLLLKVVLHDWDDERCVRILENCRRVMAPPARLLILERVIPDPDDDPAGFLESVSADMHMFAGPGGQERTRAEFETILERAGLALRNVTGTGTVLSAIEASIR